jgi:hypothetical protein
MKLNGIRPKGYKGKWGWKNILDPFIRERNRKKVQKAVQVINRHSSVPVDRSLVIYQPAVQFRRVEIPVPTMSIQSLIMIAILILIIGLGLILFAVYRYVTDEIDYKERVRAEVIYNIQRTLEPYTEQQRELLNKVSYLDNIILAHPMYRERVIKKFREANTGKEIEREVWK